MEYGQLLALAERAGKRLARYVRDSALAGSPIALEFLGLRTLLLAQWRGIGANLNQASHRSNLELVKRDADPAALRAEQAQIAAASAEIVQLAAETRAMQARYAARADAGASSPSTPAPSPAPVVDETQEGQGS